MITGKEALIALANGEDVELQTIGDMSWYDSTQWTVGELLCFKGRFRIKPRTITINGIEVPSVKMITHSGGNCVKISCHSISDAVEVHKALRSVFK